MTRYNLKMIQDRHIVSIKVIQEVVCALSNGYLDDDLGVLSTPKPPNFLHFHSLSYIRSELM